MGLQGQDAIAFVREQQGKVRKEKNERNKKKKCLFKLTTFDITMSTCTS